MSRFLILAVVLSSISAVPASPQTAPVTTPIRARGGFFRNAIDDVVFLHGLNYSHRTKRVQHAAWQQEAHFAQMKAWGFNVVRYFVMWEGIEPIRGQVNTAYLDQIERAMGWAEKHGIFVILDMHQDLYAAHFGGDGSPSWTIPEAFRGAYAPLHPWWLNYLSPAVNGSFMNFWTSADLRAKFVEAWMRVVDRAKNYRTVIGYDLYNEPHAAAPVPQIFEATVLAGFYRQVAQAIHQADPTRMIFCEPLAIVGNMGMPTGLQKPVSKSVYAPHLYDTVVHAGLPYDFGKWRTDAAMASFQAVARGWNSAAFIGEFGTERTTWGDLSATRDQLASMDEALVGGWAWYNYNPDTLNNSAQRPDHFSVVDGNGAERPVLDLLVRPYPKRVHGTPKKISYDTSSKRFQVDWKGRPGISVIHIPTRHYPNGVKVQFIRVVPLNWVQSIFGWFGPPAVPASAGTWKYNRNLQYIVAEVQGSNTDHDVRLIVRPN